MSEKPQQVKFMRDPEYWMSEFLGKPFIQLEHGRNTFMIELIGRIQKDAYEFGLVAGKK